MTELEFARFEAEAEFENVTIEALALEAVNEEIRLSKLSPADLAVEMERIKKENDAGKDLTVEQIRQGGLGASVLEGGDSSEDDADESSSKLGTDGKATTATAKDKDNGANDSSGSDGTIAAFSFVFFTSALLLLA